MVFRQSQARMTRSAFWMLTLPLASIVVSACSGHSASRTAPAAMFAQSEAGAAKSTLSREHMVVVDIPEAQLEAGFQRLVSRCVSDTAHHCTILQSDISSGDTPSALIKLRIDPQAVEETIGLAAAQGKLERRSTRVEDLADAIADTQARIEMLTSYRKQLLELQTKAGTNVDAAIKIASELSTVQTNLERANGEAAYQTKRTMTDVVNIDFVVAGHKAIWRPVSEAIRDFFGNLSNGVSQAVTAVAYIVPWLFVILPGLYLVRLLWRRRGR
jgi:hypothetical protein